MDLNGYYEHDGPASDGRPIYASATGAAGDKLYLFSDASCPDNTWFFSRTRAGRRRLDIVGDGTRKEASQGACYDPTTQITVCFRPWAYDWSSNLTQAERLSQSECEAVGNTWYAKGHIGSDGCCLCDSNCDHSLETAAAGTCNYADANAGSCKNAATGQVTCDVTAGQCASPNIWSEAGALDSDGCCFCDETCDHSAETGTDCDLKDYADESQSDGSCYSLTTYQLTCDVGHAACDAMGAYWYSPGYISGSSGCCHCDASCDHGKLRTCL